MSTSLLGDYQNDYLAHGKEAIERLPEKSPEKYVELGARLIAAAEPRPDDFSSVDSREELGRRLLQELGVDQFVITSEMAAEALGRMTDLLQDWKPSKPHMSRD